MSSKEICQSRFTDQRSRWWLRSPVHPESEQNKALHILYVHTHIQMMTHRHYKELKTQCPIWPEGVAQTSVQNKPLKIPLLICLTPQKEWALTGQSWQLEDSNLSLCYSGGNWLLLRQWCSGMGWGELVVPKIIHFDVYFTNILQTCSNTELQSRLMDLTLV